MNPELLAQLVVPAIGGLVGGIQGYKQSGGDWGAAALGTGLGAGTAWGVGKIGSGLGQAVTTRMAGKFPGLLASAADAADTPLGNLISRLPAKTPQFAGKLVDYGTQAALGATVAPVVAGGLTALGTGLAKGVTGAIGGLASASGAMRDPNAQIPQSTLESALGALQGKQFLTDPYGSTPAEVDNPLGRFATQREAEMKEQDVQNRGLRNTLATMYPWTELAKKNDALRDVAVAGMRQNIDTQARMMLQGQLGAQVMGQTALQQAGAALAHQYQYA